MNTAKKIRLSRLVRHRSGRSVFVPMDHGLTLGPITGLETIRRMARFLTHSKIDAIVAHKGVVEKLAERDLLGGKAVVVHVNGMAAFSDRADDKVSLASVRSAARLGADGVSLQINFTGRNDVENLRLLGQVSDQAVRHGLPLLTMLYDKSAATGAAASIRRQRHLLRVAIEMGSDFIKIAADPLIGEVLAGLSEDARILIAGGAVDSRATLMQRLSDALAAGAAGMCIGRNVFSDPDPGAALDRLAAVVHSVTPEHKELVHAL